MTTKTCKIVERCVSMNNDLLEKLKQISKKPHIWLPYLVIVVLIIALVKVSVTNNGVLIPDDDTPLGGNEVNAVFFLSLDGSLEGSSNTQILQHAKRIGYGSLKADTVIHDDPLAVSNILSAVPNTDMYTDKTHAISWFSTIKLSNRVYVLGRLEEVEPEPEANVFSNVDEMKKAALAVGDVVSTDGYYVANDGGAGLYEIINSAPSNSGRYIKLDNGLVASLQFDSEISIKQLGALGNGTSNDSGYLSEASKLNVDTILVPPGTYDLQNYEITLPTNMSIIGDGADCCTLKNVNIVAPYGISLSDLTLDGGTKRRVMEPGLKLIDNDKTIIIFATPRAASSISYSYCTFKNADYGSFAFWGKSGSFGLAQDSITNCTFENIKRVAVFHSVDINTGTYTNNLFRNIGDSSTVEGTLGALKVGDTTNNTTNSVQYGTISNNTFENLLSGDDSDRSKHSIACNFITVQGQTVFITNNSLTNLLGYGDDREAVYTKVRYLTVADNYIENGGFGEGYICQKGASDSDLYAKIYNNVLVGSYGMGIANFGPGEIHNNDIRISSARGGIICYGKNSEMVNQLSIYDNIIECTAGYFTLNGEQVSTYDPKYIIQVEGADVPVCIDGNSFNIGSSGPKISAVVRVGSVKSDVAVLNNSIVSTAPCGGIQINAGTSFESNNSNATVVVKENYLSVSGQPVNIRLMSESIVSERNYIIEDNVIENHGTIDYGILVTTNQNENNDTLSFSTPQEGKVFKKNQLYTNVSQVLSDNMKSIVH